MQPETAPRPETRNAAEAEPAAGRLPAPPEPAPEPEELSAYAPHYVAAVPDAGLTYRFEEAEKPGSVMIADLRRLARTCPAGLVEALAEDVFRGSPLADAFGNMATALRWPNPDAARILERHTFAACQEITYGRE